MTRHAILAILAIVLISALALIYFNKYTGQYATSYGYGANKIYGGGIRKAMAENPAVFGKKYGEQVWVQRMQEFMYSNKDKWDCNYGEEALASGYPCIFDEELKKYCCVVNTALPR